MFIIYDSYFVCVCAGLKFASHIAQNVAVCLFFPVAGALAPAPATAAAFSRGTVAQSVIVVAPSPVSVVIPLYGHGWHNIVLTFVHTLRMRKHCDNGNALMQH